MGRIPALPFDAQPGERFVYGYSTDILGALVERVAGVPLDRFLHSRILEPLGMDDTHFYLPSAKRDRLAVVYSAKEGGGIERAPDPGHMVGQGAYVDGPRKSFSGGAGFLSTASDYARFLQMLLNGGELDGKRVLTPKTVELMTADHLRGIPFRNGQGFGLGFSVVKDLGARGQPGSVGEFGWGWCLPLDLLGGPARTVGRRLFHAADPREWVGRPGQASRPDLPVHRREWGALARVSVRFRRRTVVAGKVATATGASCRF